MQVDYQPITSSRSPLQSGAGLRDAQVIELADRVGLQVHAGSQRTHLAHRPEHDARHSDLVQRQRHRLRADAAAGP
jgi:hypothetical protein